MPRTVSTLFVLLLLGAVCACQGRRIKGGWETSGQPVAQPPSYQGPSNQGPYDQGYGPIEPAPAVAPAVAHPVSDRPVPQRSFSGPRARAPRRGKVNLRVADLRGVDQWVSARNSQWILGDVVDVYASKEYFSTVLTMNAKIGMVQRKDTRVGDDHLVVMRFMGNKGSASAMTNPRVQIGTGITVSARKLLRVRMAKTTDPRRPVMLRIVAQGEAAHGRGDDTLRRDRQIDLGGTLGYRKDRYVWRAYSR